VTKIIVSQRYTGSIQAPLIGGTVDGSVVGGFVGSSLIQNPTQITALENKLNELSIQTKRQYSLANAISLQFRFNDYAFCSL
jgi:hypothetical protein